MTPNYKEFRVRWEIDLAARSPTEAAFLAQEMQRDPKSLATVFEVFERTATGLSEMAREVDTGALPAHLGKLLPKKGGR